MHKTLLVIISSAIVMNAAFAAPLSFQPPTKKAGSSSALSPNQITQQIDQLSVENQAHIKKEMDQRASVIPPLPPYKAPGQENASAPPPMEAPVAKPATKPEETPTTPALSSPTPQPGDMSRSRTALPAPSAGAPSAPPQINTPAQAPQVYTGFQGSGSGSGTGTNNSNTTKDTGWSIKY